VGAGEKIVSFESDPEERGSSFNPVDGTTRLYRAIIGSTALGHKTGAGIPKIEVAGRSFER
jgi:hypothetical protein